MDSNYKIVICISATTKTKPQDCMNNNSIQFTAENLNQLCSNICSGKNIPIQLNFRHNTQPVGWVLSGEVKDNKLFITCKVAQGLFSSYIVPGFLVKDGEFNKNNPIYKDIELVNMGTTNTPSDDGCTIFSEVLDG